MAVEHLRKHPGATLPAVGQVTEMETHKLEVEGVPVESSEMVRTRVGYLGSDKGADEFFTLDDRDHIEELLEAIKRPFKNFTSLPPEASTALTKLAEHMPDIEPAKEIQVMSACWNSVWAICNIYECFGDVVESVGIEQEEFVAVVLKKSEVCRAEGTLLIGPRGTYAFVLRRVDEESPEYGGEKNSPSSYSRMRRHALRLKNSDGNPSRIRPSPKKRHLHNAAVHSANAAISEQLIRPTDRFALIHVP